MNWYALYDYGVGLGIETGQSRVNPSNNPARSDMKYLKDSYILNKSLSCRPI